MNIDVYGQQFKLSDTGIPVLMATLVGGVGLGSVLAGVWSGGRVELGIVPLGALGIVICSLALFIPVSAVTDPAVHEEVVIRAPAWSCGWLFGLGFAAGLFSVPLDS